MAQHGEDQRIARALPQAGIFCIQRCHIDRPRWRLRRVGAERSSQRIQGRMDVAEHGHVAGKVEAQLTAPPARSG